MRADAENARSFLEAPIGPYLTVSLNLSFHWFELFKLKIQILPKPNPEMRSRKSGSLAGAMKNRAFSSPFSSTADGVSTFNFYIFSLGRKRWFVHTVIAEDEKIC